MFTGFGGLDMAVQDFMDVPSEIVWTADIKPASQYLISYRFPGVPNYEDVRLIDWSIVEPVDIVCASWPCQPFAAAGKRLGPDDPRAIWPEVVRAVEALRPRYFFGENVNRIVPTGELVRVARSLDEIGYVGGWTSLSASDIGAAHKRERCFVMALIPDA